MKFSLLLLLISTMLSAQLKLTVKELTYNRSSELISKHYLVLSYEERYRGHLLEISVRNDFDHPVTLPLDTLSFGMTFSEDFNEYFTSNGLLSDPDFNHLAGVYPFIYQSGKLAEPSRADDPLYDYQGFDDKGKIMKEREEEIEKWNKSNEIKDFKEDMMNWYLARNMVTIAPGKEFRYKMFF